jgi:hypothetical protein
MERVDAFVQVGGIVTEYGHGQQKTHGQQDAGRDVETPGATIRHGAGLRNRTTTAKNLTPRFR